MYRNRQKYNIKRVSHKSILVLAGKV